MDPDDANYEGDDDREDRRPRRYSIELDSLGGWFWLCLLTVLIFRCSGVSLW